MASPPVKFYDGTEICDIYFIFVQNHRPAALWCQARIVTGAGGSYARLPRVGSGQVQAAATLKRSGHAMPCVYICFKDNEFVGRVPRVCRRGLKLHQFLDVRCDVAVVEVELGQRLLAQAGDFGFQVVLVGGHVELVVDAERQPAAGLLRLQQRLGLFLGNFRVVVRVVHDRVVVGVFQLVEPRLAFDRFGVVAFGVQVVIGGAGLIDVDQRAAAVLDAPGDDLGKILGI